MIKNQKYTNSFSNDQNGAGKSYFEPHSPPLKQNQKKTRREKYNSFTIFPSANSSKIIKKKKELKRGSHCMKNFAKYFV